MADLSTLEGKISFYKEKLELCWKVKAEIQPNDVYRDIKIKALNRFIKSYEDELKKLNPGDLRRWT